MGTVEERRGTGVEGAKVGREGDRENGMESSTMSKASAGRIVSYSDGRYVQGQGAKRAQKRVSLNSRVDMPLSLRSILSYSDEWFTAIASLQPSDLRSSSNLT